MKTPPRARINGPRKPGKPGIKIARPSTGAGISKTGIVRRAKKANYLGGLKSDEWKDRKKEVKAVFNNCCGRCGIHQSKIPDGGRLALHHIKQASRGGTDSKSNLIPLCPACHSKNFLHGHLYKDEQRKKIARQNKR
ncbi:HNH endonuclease [Pseudomonas phage vB_PpuM-Peetri]